MDQKKTPALGDIFRKYGPLYRTVHKGHIPLQHLKIMNSIEACRTAALGCNVYKCKQCGKLHFVYESCGNRHCPQCQSLKAERWVAEKKKALLPIQYFHVVFTVPSQLNPLFLRNKKIMYKILFDSVSQTLQEISKEKKHLGAKIGFFSILHTWGQNMMDHPHIHNVVTGGGLNEDKSKWISTRKDFFIPVKVLSKRFRSIFLLKLKAAKKAESLHFPGKINNLSHSHVFQKLIDELFKCEWVVYCKRPFKRPETVLEYLSRYSYKVAISNHRILKVENGFVYFRYRDYKDQAKNKIMKLEIFEFIRRFLLHVLPDRFMKIRYYGLLANNCRENNLLLCWKLLESSCTDPKNKKNRMCWKELAEKMQVKKIFCCPVCHKGELFLFKVLSFRSRGRSP